MVIHGHHLLNFIWDSVCLARSCEFHSLHANESVLSLGCGQLWVRHMICGQTCDELYHFTFYLIVLENIVCYKDHHPFMSVESALSQWFTYGWLPQAKVRQKDNNYYNLMSLLLSSDIMFVDERMELPVIWLKLLSYWAVTTNIVQGCLVCM